MVNAGNLTYILPSLLSSSVLASFSLLFFSSSFSLLFFGLASVSLLFFSPFFTDNYLSSPAAFDEWRRGLITGEER